MNDRAFTRILFCAIFVALLLVALALRACAGQQLEFAETALVPLESHYDADMLDTHCPLYRCGEVVHVNGRLAIIWDYRFDGREWRYTVRKARYNK